MTLRSRFTAYTLLLALALPVLIHGQQPTFRTGVDLIRLDVRVVDDNGTPVDDLVEDDFTVQVNGKVQPVRTVRFIDLRSGEAPINPHPDYSTNIIRSTGRLTVIAIDESSLPEDSRPLMNGLADYLATTTAADRTGLLAMPRPGIWMDFTNDAGALRDTLMRVSARRRDDVPSRAPDMGRGETPDVSPVDSSGSHRPTTSGTRT
jgi:VWFA-related protein